MREADLAVDGADFEAMGVDELVALTHEAGLRRLEELACHGTGAVVQATVDDRYDEARLEALEYVESWDHVAAVDGGHVYVVAFVAPALPEAAGEAASDLVGTCDPDLADGGATVSLTGPQGAISETVAAFERAGVAPDLRRLGGYEGSADPMADLTDRQREVVRTAYGMGYYEVPRAASTADVAAELDVDPSTVAEHLQRAERNLLAHHLEPGE